ncbi:MAG: dTDP-L-rhamnose 4-epimerase [Acidobacteriota bacterium]|nr:dTDP-L-rhamnose 4-epimerase [Acidobacteriota bacterium]
MRILITGGAGFIGSHLARQLLSMGHSVVVFDNLLPQVHGSNPQLALTGCETVWADVRDSKAVAEVMKGIDVVHHLAAETGVGQSQYEIERYVSTNTYGTAVVLEAAAAAQVRQVITASSRAVYGEGQYHCSNCGQTFVAESRSDSEMEAGIWDISCPRCEQLCEPIPMAEDAPLSPISIYGITKLQQEQLARGVSQAHHLPVTILRFFNVFGPGQSLSNPYVGVLGTFFRRARGGLTVEIYEDGQMLRDFVFVNDVVEALQLCTGNQSSFGQTLNVGLGEAVTLSQVAAEMFRALELEPRMTISGRYRLGDIRHAIAKVSNLESVLGFRPQTSFAQGLRLYAKWALENESDAPDNVAEEQLVARNLLRQGRR